MATIIIFLNIFLLTHCHRTLSQVWCRRDKGWLRPWKTSKLRTPFNFTSHHTRDAISINRSRTWSSNMGWRRLMGAGLRCTTSRAWTSKEPGSETWAISTTNHSAPNSLCSCKTDPPSVTKSFLYVSPRKRCSSRPTRTSPSTQGSSSQAPPSFKCNPLIMLITTCSCPLQQRRCRKHSSATLILVLFTLRHPIWKDLLLITQPSGRCASQTTSFWLWMRPTVPTSISTRAFPSGLSRAVQMQQCAAFTRPWAHFQQVPSLMLARIHDFPPPRSEIPTTYWILLHQAHFFWRT